MIASLLIANRGEIACRIIRTARRMGVRTIAVYSTADAGAVHVREADAAVEIGPPAPRESYLDIDAVLAAARSSGATAVHPGYGFLSENAAFAEAVLAAGLIWVGPPPAAIRAMGLKDAAKRLMAQAGVPVTPGYLGEDQSAETLAAEAAAMGWPVLIKAVAGGGGKGMRAVHSPNGFAEALAGARREAASAFGDDRVLLEKLIASPRHIEVQVFCDAQGAAVHLFERDCSLQRRHQKVIEEAPAPGLAADVRDTVCGAAIRAARAVGYVGAGTVEFIADGSQGLRADRIWFMEMNTRLQVEHPVTEAVTGVDLVEWQLRVAAGEPLPLSQAEIALNGHAMEARLYAEDPVHGFLPSIGPLTRLRLPQGVRVDSGVREGDAITPYYDPMLAKLIAWGETREAAAASLAAACRKVQVWPIRANAAFLARCADHAAFRAGQVHTGFIDENLAALAPPASGAKSTAAVGRLGRSGATEALASPWEPARGALGFRLNAAPRARAWVYRDGIPMELGYDFESCDENLIEVEGEVVAFADGDWHDYALARPQAIGGAGALSDGAVMTPMPGRIVAVHVALGDHVAAGQALVVLEAMKMEHALVAPAPGRVAELNVATGDQVSEAMLAVRLEPEDAA
jgi:3-methylcrotonyl-CoA carboxylase alpha subunit